MSVAFNLEPSIAPALSEDVVSAAFAAPRASASYSTPNLGGSVSPGPRTSESRVSLGVDLSAAFPSPSHLRKTDTQTPTALKTSYTFFGGKVHVPRFRPGPRLRWAMEIMRDEEPELERLLRLVHWCRAVSVAQCVMGLAMVLLFALWLTHGKASDNGASNVDNRRNLSILCGVLSVLAGGMGAVGAAKRLEFLVRLQFVASAWALQTSTFLMFEGANATRLHSDLCFPSVAVYAIENPDATFAVCTLGLGKIYFEMCLIVVVVVFSLTVAVSSYDLNDALNDVAARPMKPWQVLEFINWCAEDGHNEVYVDEFIKYQQRYKVMPKPMQDELRSRCIAADMSGRGGVVRPKVFITIYDRLFGVTSRKFSVAAALVQQQSPRKPQGRPYKVTGAQGDVGAESSTETDTTTTDEDPTLPVGADTPPPRRDETPQPEGVADGMGSVLFDDDVVVDGAVAAIPSVPPPPAPPLVDGAQHGASASFSPGMAGSDEATAMGLPNVRGQAGEEAHHAHHYHHAESGGGSTPNSSSGSSTPSITYSPRLDQAIPVPHDVDDPAPQLPLAVGAHEEEEPTAPPLLRQQGEDAAAPLTRKDTVTMALPPPAQEESLPATDTPPPAPPPAADATPPLPTPQWAAVVAEGDELTLPEDHGPDHSGQPDMVRTEATLPPLAPASEQPQHDDGVVALPNPFDVVAVHDESEPRADEFPAVTPPAPPMEVPTVTPPPPPVVSGALAAAMAFDLEEEEELDWS